MSVLLGVDTGGTYTDAVLIRDETEVIATAKALTTRADLAVGVEEAVRAVLQGAAVAPEEIALASLSTTLATNALVEGQGGRVALIYIGFRTTDLGAHGLAEAMAGDPVLHCAGGHDHAGIERQPLDEAAIRAFLQEHGDDVSGIAVAAQFATRNPAHEVRARSLVAELSGRPVSASHQLSSRLNGPKRAVTAVLNARLIGMIAALIARTETALSGLGVSAPLMVVRGDGALISAGQARARPIETILSGPAASIVGARWLTGATEALVSDIGGTTTDIALLQDGVPKIDPAGARVGPYRTMVEAVAMRTTGLGGDSEVRVIADGLQGGVALGPCRVVPVALLAAEVGQPVHDLLDAQLRTATPGAHDARFVRAVRGLPRHGLAAREAQLLERIGAGTHALDRILRVRMDESALDRLIARGLVQVAGVTPSDASHVTGQLAEWDKAAAEKALTLMARRKVGSGQRLAAGAAALAWMIINQLTEMTSQALLEAAFAEEARDFGETPHVLARHPLMQAGLDRHRGLIRLDIGLNLPVVGLGASAGCYYPAVGERVCSEMILPSHGAVANAIGAVVGRVSMRCSGTVTALGEGVFRVHLEDGPADIDDEEAALDALERALSADARAAAQAAGVVDARLTATRDIRRARVDNREVFVEAVLTVEASGRPRIASG
ncbi:hydantoinase/oxoprolinase N-terminal domain-containing protein [Roseobacter cerasinus]|uniref:hydantoinase/oxoprolinase N-terminal domain-containing protein n=1 Tax=Roseobacter cerasinus TaxID=2602289 RepID=UPI0013574287|nr:hydantoinase/oxoprolinase family protein [Roseobacter cerasinus]